VDLAGITYHGIATIITANVGFTFRSYRYLPPQRPIDTYFVHLGMLHFFLRLLLKLHTVLAKTLHAINIIVGSQNSKSTNLL
jgi:hypothetical protein